MFFPILPDIFLLAFPFTIILIGLFSKSEKVTQVLSSVFLAIIFVLYNLQLLGETQVYLSNWKIDTFGLFMREVFVLSAFFSLWFAKNYFEKDSAGKPRLKSFAEFASLVGFASFGGVVIVSACDLLTLFIGLELAAIPMYALSAWNKRDEEGAEAAVKFILMGSAAAAFELFGLSYLYGFAGTLDMKQIAEAVSENPPSPLLWLSVLFLVAGIGFKLTLFPFHTWAPDVYEGAPTPVTALLSVTSKASAIAFLSVLVFGPFRAVHTEIAPFLALLAGVTLFAGNLGALKQTKLRRFMAYSSISQAGYMLIALSGEELFAKNALLFYLFLYTFANYLAFFIFSAVCKSKKEEFRSLEGLSKENLPFACALAVSLFSLAGIPPLAGFFGKFHLLFAAAQSHFYLLVAFAVLNNVLALYYYIQVLKSAWIDSPSKEANSPLSVLNTALPTRSEKISVFILTVLTIGAGALPILANNIFAGLSL